MNYLFSENQVEGLDLHSHLAEISQIKTGNRRPAPKNRVSYKKVFQALRYYDNFLDSITNHPDHKLLTLCFYLYHLNHYAKTYTDKSAALYGVKHQVLRKLCGEYPQKIIITYLLGPDRNKVWLCEDCKDSARSAGLSYAAYVKKEMYCSKCYVTPIEREYYSLVEFSVIIDDYSFSFHAPRASVQKWIDTAKIPQKIRNTGKYSDRMYVYGRLITQVEEKIFPLPMVLDFLHAYLEEPGI